jgi:hypothetical protein
VVREHNHNSAIPQNIDHSIVVRGWFPDHEDNVTCRHHDRNTRSLVHADRFLSKAEVLAEHRSPALAPQHNLCLRVLHSRPEQAIRRLQGPRDFELRHSRAL